MRIGPAPGATPRRAHYDAVIVGGGGHGLATAYYLARKHGITQRRRAREGLDRRRQHGPQYDDRPLQLHLDAQSALLRARRSSCGSACRASSTSTSWTAARRAEPRALAGRADAAMRRGNAMRLNGIDAEFLDARRDRAAHPQARLFARRPLPDHGGLLQPRGGIVRHDAVAWGYARAADALGVDIIQHCEVTGIRIEAVRVTGVETTRGFIATRKVGIAVAGHSAHVARWPGSGCRSRRICCRRWSPSR